MKPALAVVLALSLAACGADGTTVRIDPTIGSSETSSSPGSTTPPPTRDERTSGATTPAVATTTETPSSVPASDALIAPSSTTSTTTPVSSEPPALDVLVQQIREHAAGRIGAQPADFALLKADEVIWSDGSLGCAEVGMVYTQATVAGYWVVLELNNVRFDYRSGEGGFFKPCLARTGTSPTSIPEKCVNC